MAGTFRKDFARIVALARVKLEQVEVIQEIDTERAILIIKGQRPPYRIFIKETISSKGRRYAYYILKDELVILPDYCNFLEYYGLPNLCDLAIL